MAGFSFHPHRGLFGTFDQPSFRAKNLIAFRSGYLTAGRLATCMPTFSLLPPERIHISP
jgi:hypothetical protein